MMKLLFISNIIGKGIGSFSIASIKAANYLGIEFHVAANFNNSTCDQMKKDEEEFGITLHHIDFIRNPTDIANKKAYKQVVDLIYKEHFDIIHCNTPIGGLIGRLAGKKCGVKTVIYQVHGFHFWKGAPIKNWLVYYPVERVLAHYTDALITINKEDYNRAQGFKLRNHGKVYYVPGVGINTDRFIDVNVERNIKRKELGLSENDVALLSVGEYTEDKNHLFAIEAMKKLPQNYKYFLCGEGHLRYKYEAYIKEHHLENKVFLLGYRTDIPELLKVCDLYVFPSSMEGLSRALMEAMAAGIPIVCSKIRGNVDLIQDNNCLFEYDSEEQFLGSIEYTLSSAKMVVEQNWNNLKRYTLPAVINDLISVYKDNIGRMKA